MSKTRTRTRARARKKQLGNPAIAAMGSAIPKGVWYLVAGAVVFGGWYLVKKTTGVIDSVTSAVGLSESENEKAIQSFEKTTSYMLGFNPNFWTTVSLSRDFISQDKANHYADMIDDAFGFFNDNEEQVLGVFRVLKSLAEMSRVSDAYMSKYSQDLWSEIQGKMSDSEIVEIVKIAKTKNKT